MAPTALTAHRPLHGNYCPCLLRTSEGAYILRTAHQRGGLYTTYCAPARGPTYYLLRTSEGAYILLTAHPRGGPIYLYTTYCAPARGPTYYLLRTSEGRDHDASTVSSKESE
eukprot:scaffold95567_cov54-Phaeocystis_antarctica.AAC.2